MATTPGNSHASSGAKPNPQTILDGKYRIERVIGEGAFGRVYLAFDPLLRRNAAVKELLASSTTADPTLYEKYLERFQREARAAGRLEHPNVVGVYELAVDRANNYYLVMQYVDGTNLRDLLVQVGTLPVQRAVAIALDVAQGLAVIHEQDIVHRDLKPANIMLTSRGTARITDFGIAQVGHESLRTQMAIGHPGTPLYMSPEQASGVAYIDGRSDLYSLGLILYELLVGEPYARRRQPLAQIRPDLPPLLYRIVNTLIEPDPVRRYQSARDLVADLHPLGVAPIIPANNPGPYQMPDIAQTRPDRTVLQGALSPPFPVGSVGGVPEAYGGSLPTIVDATIRAPPPVQSPYQQPPGTWYVNPVPPAPPSPEETRALAKRHVRVRPGYNGLPEYVVDSGAILRKILLLLVLAFALWLGLGFAGSVYRVGSTGYYYLLTAWIVLTVSAPIGLTIMFFTLRSRAKAIVKSSSQNRSS
jgi:serine/threonine protein kinase